MKLNLTCKIFGHDDEWYSIAPPSNELAPNGRRRKLVAAKILSFKCANCGRIKESDD